MSNSKEHKVVKALQMWIEKKKSTGMFEDTTVRTGEAWRSSGEMYGEGAVAVLVTEGDFYRALNYAEHKEDRDLAAEFIKIVEENGCWTEPAYGWAWVIMRNEDK